MANVNTTLISNRTATPRVANDPWNNAKMKSTGVGLLEVSTAVDVTHILRFVSVPSNAVVREVNLYCDAVATGGAIDVGVYRTIDDGSAVVDVDLFASAQVVTTALVRTNVAHESGQFDISELGQRLWQAAGMASDPGGWLDIAGTVTTDMGGAGTIGLDVVYVDGGA